MLAFIGGWLILHPYSGEAGQFRSFVAIAAPEENPAGFTRPAKPRSLPRPLVEKVVKNVMDSWNTGQMDHYLSESFQDKSRLLDAMVEHVPKDAKIRVMSIRGVQLLDQVERANSDGLTTIHTVSVAVRTQVEFNHPTNGQQRLDGNNEMILRITTREATP
ncbi:MAG: hypothetical protein G8345_14090 [Magnetococcales bacterium]|nr:hypothetical protein [Magnetococcales bacterium]NGZ28007.1 hypothetical protein [Magnetococcales bacterium]